VPSLGVEEKLLEDVEDLLEESPLREVVSFS
jgi:hypothetical protein